MRHVYGHEKAYSAMEKQTNGIALFAKTRRMILNRVLLPPFAAVVMVCATLIYHFASSLQEQVSRELLRVVDSHRHSIDNFLQERSANLRFVASVFSSEQLQNEEMLARIFEELQKNSTAFSDLGVFDEQGNHVAYLGPFLYLKGKNYSQSPWFLAMQDRELYISDVFMGYRNIPHFVIAVKKEENSRVWYLRATIDTLHFNELVESLYIGRHGEAYLLNKDGVFQTRRRSGGALMETDPDKDMYVASAKTVATFEDRDGKKHIYATGKLQSVHWMLVARQETGDAYAPLLRALIFAVLVIAVGGVLVVYLGFVLASGVANQLTVAEIEKRQMSTQLIMAGKFAEIGEMSSGIAHEINNPLQVMKAEYGMLHTVLGEIERGEAACDRENIALLRDSIDQIDLQIERCKKITQGLLKFARQSEASLETMDVEKFLAEVVKMIENRAHSDGVRIILETEKNLPPILSSPDQLQQVFLNLLNNAIYALQHRREPAIRICTIRENDALCITISDNGCGIPPQNLKKIFIPFFTTKPVGQGTGLGLSTCYGIVERLGGRIHVASQLDSGTTFTVKLPFHASETDGSH